MDGCISVFLRFFFNWSMRIYSKYKLFIFSSLCILLQFLNAAICSLITLFFKCSKEHQILPQFSTINLTQVMHINIFGRDYLNLNNPIPSKDINLQYTRFIVENRDNIWCSKKEGLFWHNIFKANILPTLWQRIDLVEDYCQQFFKYLIIYFR